MMTATSEGRNFTFLQVIRLKNAELWESKLNHYVMHHKGDLQLLYSEILDLAVIRLSGQTWVLDKKLQIIGTRSHLGGWQCYSIPSPGGFFLLKITNLQFEGELHPELINFETVLENYSDFKRVDALEAQFSFFTERPAPSGLESLKENLFKVVDKIEDNFFHSDSANHPNNKIVRPLNELLAVNTDAVPMVDVTEHDLNGIRGDIELLIKDHQDTGTWKEFWEGHPQDLSVKLESLEIHAAQKHEQSLLESGSQDVSRLSQQGTQDYKPPAVGTFHHDSQELLGGESQRLPSYEIENTSKSVHKGFNEASSKLGDDSTLTSNIKEDTDFTTGLLKDNIEPSPKTPYHKNEESNPPVDLKPNADLTKKVDLPRESLQMESWGSNVTNASETTPTIDSEFGKSSAFGNIRAGEQRTTEKTGDLSEKLSEKETAGAI